MTDADKKWAQEMINSHPEKSAFWCSDAGQDATYIARALGLKFPSGKAA